MDYGSYSPEWFEAIDLQVKKLTLKFKSVEGEPHLLFYRQEKSEKVILEGGVEQKGKEPPTFVEQIDVKVPPSAEASQSTETHEGPSNLPRLVEVAPPIENLPLPVEGPPPIQNLPLPFEGSGPMELCANVIRPLPNLGLSCFFNAALQCLLSLDSLRTKVLGPNVPTGPLFSSLKRLFIQTSVLCPEQLPLDPKDLLSSIHKLCPQLKPETEEDSSEFLTVFLNQLDIEEIDTIVDSLCRGSMKPIDTIVNSLFRGSISCTISSTECPHKSLPSEQKIIDIILRVPKGNLEVSIEKLLELYTEKRKLAEVWPCPFCKATKEAEQKILVAKAPSVLILSLHNYEFLSTTKTKKLEVKVRFKEVFDIRHFVEQRSMEVNTLYKLVGVIVHSGDPKGGAHYVSYVRANKMEGPNHHKSGSKTWFYASDIHVREARLDEVLGCNPYILFYERCCADLTGEDSQLALDVLPQFSADPMGEEFHADSNMQPPTGASAIGSSLVPNLWEFPKTRNPDRQAKNKLDQAKDRVGQLLGFFLDRYTLQGDTRPYYHFELTTMCERGSGSRELRIDYSHLLSHSKALAMNVCNGYDGLMLNFKEAAMNFAKKLAADEELVLSETARKRLEKFASVQKDLDSSLSLRFVEMPKVHKLLKGLLLPPLTQEMKVQGHILPKIRKPVPEKCSLVQRLFIDVIDSHRVGFSWNGDFTLDDMELKDDRVLIAKTPKHFPILPAISPALIRAMSKDFFRIADLVIAKFRDLGDGLMKASIPYLETFYQMLTEMYKYEEFWSNNEKAELLRDLIIHHPFLKPGMARWHFWSGLFAANRSHDQGDCNAPFKKVLESHLSVFEQSDFTSASWYEKPYFGPKGNPVAVRVFEHEDKKRAATDPSTSAAATDPATPAAATDPATPAASTDSTTPPAAAATDPTEATDSAAARIETYYGDTGDFLIEYVRYLCLHGSAYSFQHRPRGTGPRRQMMKSLDETETAAAYALEEEIVGVLVELCRNSAIKGMLKSVWDCYKSTNHSSSRP